MLFRKFCLVIIATSISYCVMAQDAVVSACANAKANGGSFSFSMGQVFYDPISDSEISVSAGIQSVAKNDGDPTQSKKISATGGVDVKVYPNPVHDFCVISSFGAPSDVEYRLVDVCGRNVASGRIVESARLSLESLPSGVYLLRVVTHNRLAIAKTVKIVKE